MASTIAKLSVVLSANTSRFSKGMQRAGRGVTRFQSNVLNATRRLRFFSAGLIAAAAGGGLGLLTINAFKSGNALAKTSDKLGIATERLAGLQHAAQLAGVPVSQMEMGLQRMTRRVSEAAMGTGEAQGALLELGLDAQKLAKMSPDEQFRAIATAMQQVSSQSDRVRLGFKLFDSEGVALINMMKRGTEQIDEGYREAEKFGQALSRVDASKLEQANDAVFRIRQYLGGIVKQFAVQLAPIIAKVANLFVQWATNGSNSGEVAKAIFESVQGVVIEIARAVQSMTEAFMRARIMFLKWKADSLAGLGQSPKELVEINRTIRDMEFALQRMEKQDYGKNVFEWMEAARHEAEKIAEDALSIPDVSADQLPEVAAAGTAASGPTAFRQFDITRTNLAGFSRRSNTPQKTEDKKTHAKLDEIKTAIRATGGAVLA